MELGQILNCLLDGHGMERRDPRNRPVRLNCAVCKRDAKPVHDGKRVCRHGEVWERLASARGDEEESYAGLRDAVVT